MDTTKELSAIEWCAGYGGIHLGLKRAIPSLRVIAYGEIEAFACANLVAKMEAGLMDAAPIWTDIKTFPCEAFRDRVDLLVAGYPCQPFSAAGKRLGTEDPRHLWPHILGAIRIIRPRICFFENVEGHISLGLREVLGDLGAAGYTAAWGIFSASEVGAPHQRKRVFILAVSNSLGSAAGLSRSLAGHEGIAGESNHGGGKGDCVAESSPQHAQGCIDGMLRREDREDGLPWEHRGSSISCGTAWPSRPGEPQHAWEPPRVVANNHRPHAGHGEQRPERTSGDLSGGCSEAMGNASRLRSREPANGRGQAASWADASGEERMADTQGSQRWITIAADNSGRWIAETGRSNGKGNNRQTQPPLGGDLDGPAGGLGYAELCVTCDNRTDELRLLGNGVVPATAERAFRVLMHELCSNT